jgi:hypothetical protein
MQMSDSSLGDSLFSSDANKRYFGSSESCRFKQERGRRCSLENENACFSDTCRQECDLRNCDCSSSYFSSDFDDTNIYNSSRMNYRSQENSKENSKKENSFVKKASRGINVMASEVMNPQILNNMNYDSLKNSPKLSSLQCKTTENDSSKMSLQCESKDAIKKVMSDSKGKKDSNRNKIRIQDDYDTPHQKSIPIENNKSIKNQSTDEKLLKASANQNLKKNEMLENDEDEVFTTNENDKVTVSAIILFP